MDGNPSPSRGMHELVKMIKNLLNIKKKLTWKKFQLNDQLIQLLEEFVDTDT